MFQDGSDKNPKLKRRRQVHAGPDRAPAAKTAPRARGTDAEARTARYRDACDRAVPCGSGPAPSCRTVRRSAGGRESTGGLPHECGAACRLPSRPVDRRPTGRDVLQEEKCGPPTPDGRARASGPASNLGLRPGFQRAPSGGRGASARRRRESLLSTFRVFSVYPWAVSRTLELSLQSSFQLSLTVLVDYRSRAGI